MDLSEPLEVLSPVGQGREEEILAQMYRQHEGGAAEGREAGLSSKLPVISKLLLLRQLQQIPFSVKVVP